MRVVCLACWRAGGRVGHRWAGRRQSRCSLWGRKLGDSRASIVTEADAALASSPYSSTVRVGNMRMSTTAMAFTAAEAPRAEGAKPNQRARPKRPSPVGRGRRVGVGGARLCQLCSLIALSPLIQLGMQPPGMLHTRSMQLNNRAGAAHSSTADHSAFQPYSAHSLCAASSKPAHHACMIGRSTSRSALASPPRRLPGTSTAAAGRGWGQGGEHELRRPPPTNTAQLPPVVAGRACTPSVSVIPASQSGRQSCMQPARCTAAPKACLPAAKEV